MRYIITLISLLYCFGSFAQTLSLEGAISTARIQSVEAKEARQSFISTYWAYRSYKASRLPNDFRRQIFTAVGQFNNQRHQCSVSKRAMLIALERYELMMEKFRSGKASVMELNTAQSENDTALQKYIADVSNFWEYYYTLRQYTLYDFIEGKDMEIDVNEMIY